MYPYMSYNELKLQRYRSGYYTEGNTSALSISLGFLERMGEKTPLREMMVNENTHAQLSTSPHLPAKPSLHVHHHHTYTTLIDTTPY